MSAPIVKQQLRVTNKILKTKMENIIIVLNHCEKIVTEFLPDHFIHGMMGMLVSEFIINEYKSMIDTIDAVIIQKT